MHTCPLDINPDAIIGFCGAWVTCFLCNPVIHRFHKDFQMFEPHVVEDTHS